jgi:MraZ protein
MDSDSQGQTPGVEAPRGMHSGRVDDKGRIKLASVFQQYLEAQPEKKLFVTSLDGRIAKIYPIAVWRENEKLLQDYRGNPQSARIVSFNANRFGADADMDSQGRVLLPQRMRQTLGIEDSTVYVMAKNGSIEIYTEAMYQAWEQMASDGAEQAVADLESVGLR